MTVFWKTDRLARKTKFFFFYYFVAFFVERRCRRPNLKPLQLLRVRRASFSLFPLVSSCLNDYFRMYAIIDFLANWLGFVNMTFESICK